MTCKRFRIISSAGVDLGVYEGETEAEALDALARDAGYANQAEAPDAFDGEVIDEDDRSFDADDDDDGCPSEYATDEELMITEIVTASTSVFLGDESAHTCAICGESASHRTDVEGREIFECEKHIRERWTRENDADDRAMLRKYKLLREVKS